MGYNFDNPDQEYSVIAQHKNLGCIGHVDT